VDDEKKRNSYLNIVPNTSCHNEHAKLNVNCQKSKCRQWQDMPEYHNCIMIAAKENGTHTLQEIGDIFDVTRMRICQIEKLIFKKLLKHQNTLIEFED